MKNRIEYRRYTDYVYGSEVKKQEIKKAIETAPVTAPAAEATVRHKVINIWAALFIMVAICISGLILVHYIRLTSELVNKTRQIAVMESKLNDLRLANDEELGRIENSIDLEEIRRIAISELGMKYADQGQIVTFKKQGNDYMRKASGD
ncbi:MAG: cell division protein FtsL [Lachnospiraceae bacterium]|nr:cell division protein FtsL [Lachnospiraceae bacterium]